MSTQLWIPASPGIMANLQLPQVKQVTVSEPESISTVSWNHFWESPFLPLSYSFSVGDYFLPENHQGSHVDFGRV